MLTIANMWNLTKPNMNTTNCDVWNLSKLVTCLPISIYAADSFETSTHAHEGFSDITTRGKEFLESVKKGSASNATLYHDNRCNNKCFGQPFGSMPRCCSSLRNTRLIQVANEESPSLRISSSSWERNSSLNRMGNCGERFSGIDMVYAIGNIVRVYTSVYANGIEAQRPEVLPALKGRLITTLKQVTL